MTRSAQEPLGETRPARGARLRAAASALLVAGLIGVLAACTSDPLADQYRAGDNKGFVAADGFRVVEIPAEERTDPVEFEGVLDTGETTSSADYDGDVLVVNFWYAACAPCRVEAPELAAADAAFDGQDVAFLGINLYDGAEASLAFARKYGVEYPSALATEDGSIKLAFAGETPLNAVPVTLVLDKEGRVAARLVGQIEEASILETLVRETLEES
ncbi:TlpA disulfide reductase family protein [Microbacterium sp. M3]|uniref:TlpA disulfide reductase family protein n=1 Tax=Microbacterium arthrosphaerae TaxID=792652 RepID=A0ABU4GXK7_9MICO|nr:MULTISPECIES: TlpA disulfide reductase family protein [Microbacterium]MDW4571816.1 TlpA disulfide reductase family protein [Microbacterium arthrosphaerae]MDW7605671.1 TlpA disulfide reductase family protein [Microbacterium sp. M3]